MRVSSSLWEGLTLLEEKERGTRGRQGGVPPPRADALPLAELTPLFIEIMIQFVFKFFVFDIVCNILFYFINL